MCASPSILSLDRFLTNFAKRRRPDAIRQIIELQSKLPPSAISLAAGSPNHQAFPFAEFTFKLKNYNAGWEAVGTSETSEPLIINGEKLRSALQYLPTPGFPPLVDWLKQFQQRYHQLSAERMQLLDLLVTVGCHDAISKAFEMLLEPGDPVIIHVPLFTGVLTDLMAFDPHWLQVPCDQFGMIPEQLKQALENYSGKRRPKVLYINPTGCNPNGTSMPTSRKKIIYGIAQQYDLIILEDDPYCFLRFDHIDHPQQQQPSLDDNNEDESFESFLSLDKADGRVLRFDSMSKVFSAGMRIGFVTGPKRLLDVIAWHMQVSVIHANALSQVCIYEALCYWDYEGLLRHLRQVALFYCHQRDAMLAAADRHLQGLATWYQPSAGMFLWLRLLNVTDSTELIEKRALEKEVLFVPGAYFYPPAAADAAATAGAAAMSPDSAGDADSDGQRRQHVQGGKSRQREYSIGQQFVRACYSTASVEQIDEGLRRLAACLREQQQQVCRS